MHFQESVEKMAYRCSSSSVMSAVLILLALNYSSVECDQGSLVTEAEKDVFFLQTNTKFHLGRKMLQEIDTKPADLNKSFPEIQAKKQSLKPTPDESKRDHTSSNAKDESEAFLDLMRKDYRGIARRKPPIHNREPND